MDPHSDPLTVRTDLGSDLSTNELTSHSNPQLYQDPSSDYFWVRIPISPIRITKFLAFIAIGLVSFSVIGQLYKCLVLNATTSRGVIRLFDLDSEWNFPSEFQYLNLLICSGLLAVIAIIKLRSRASYRWHWLLLSLLFFFLSQDELIGFHEATIEPLRHALKASGIFYFTWVVLGLGLVAGVGLLYLKFLWALPKRSRNLFLLSAAIYLTGAIGIEMLGGAYVAQYVEGDLIYTLFATTEETLETSGQILFIYTLLDYIQRFIAQPLGRGTGKA